MLMKYNMSRNEHRFGMKVIQLVDFNGIGITKKDTRNGSRIKFVSSSTQRRSIG
jgi:hypothetical protein